MSAVMSWRPTITGIVTASKTSGSICWICVSRNCVKARTSRPSLRPAGCQRRPSTRLSLRVNRSANWQDGRCNRRGEEADDEVLSRILGIISDMPSYGYRRVWAIMRKQLRNEGLPPVNAKRVYRVIREHNLLLLHDKPQRPKRKHNGKIAVTESNQRWCSDGLEFGCDDGEKLRVTFALDCCDREAIDWAASTGGYDSTTVQDVMPGAVEKRFGSTLPN